MSIKKDWAYIFFRLVSVKIILMMDFQLFNTLLNLGYNLSNNEIQFAIGEQKYCQKFKIKAFLLCLRL